MKVYYRDYLIRHWESRDRAAAAAIIGQVLSEYSLNWEPEGADRDVLEVERCYQQSGGEFWVIEQAEKLVGTAAYYPVQCSAQSVEVRKMYLLPEVRGQGLGRFLLQTLEGAIAAQGFQTIWLETASPLIEAIALYEASGYQPSTGVETARCDRIYQKSLAPNPAH